MMGLRGVHEVAVRFMRVTLRIHRILVSKKRVQYSEMDEGAQRQNPRRPIPVPDTKISDIAYVLSRTVGGAATVVNL